MFDFQSKRNRYKYSKITHFQSNHTSISMFIVTFCLVTQVIIAKEKRCSAIGDTEITHIHELSNAFNRNFTDIGPNLPSKINPPRVSSFGDFVEPCDRGVSKTKTQKRRPKMVFQLAFQSYRLLLLRLP